MESDRWRRGDCIAIIALAAAPMSFFWPHLIGDAMFIGDSDRLSHHLTWLQHLTAGLREGRLPTWNEAVFGGYSTVALPYAFPNPLVLVALLWPASEVVYAAGLVTMLLLVLSAWAAYVFIRALTGAAFPAFCGAAVYAFSALSILRVSQIDSTYFTYVITPLLLWALHRAGPGTMRSSFLISTALLVLLFATGFLQEVVYALMLWGLVALYMAWRRRDRGILLVAGTSGVAALLIAMPRIVAVGREFTSSVRHYGEQSSRDFETVYRAANLVYPTQILRWFDDRIFGLTMPQVDLHNSGINLHEGLVLYASSFAAFLVVFGALRHGRAWIGREKVVGELAPVFLLFFVFAVFVALTRAGYWAMYHLLFRIDFMHGRIVSAAILPQAALAAIFVYHLAIGNAPARKLAVPTYVVVGCALVSALVLGGIERWSRSLPGFTRLLQTDRYGPPVTVADGAAFRVLASFGLFLLVLLLIYVFRRRELLRAGLACLLGFLMVGQVFIYARQQISGTQMQADKPPFLEPVRLLAKGHEFRWPSASAQGAMGSALETDRFRTALICDRTVIRVPCSTHIANFWGLRAVEGYVSSIPLRVAVLPWSAAVSLRYVTFWTADSLPWGLLGLLNVKYAIPATRALVTNSVRDTDGRLRELGPQDVRILHNTHPVTPRVFFAESVQPVANIDEAMNRLFPGGKVEQSGYDVVGLSYAEAYSGPVRFPRSGAIRANFVDQDAQIEFAPSDQPRFLVVNERFDGDWRAYAGDVELPIHPTNVFMRGVLVPSGVDSVRLHYRPFVQTPTAAAIFLLGVALLAFGAMFAGKLDRHYPPHA